MFDPTTLVGFHTWLSLIGLAAGFVVTVGLIRGRGLPGWTGLFLVTAVATSVTGFVFQITKVTPALIVGVVALVTLAAAIAARYRYGMQGRWRALYVVTAVFNVYLLAFVGIAQSFQKVPALKALAPTGSEPPFLVAQVVVLILFVALGVAAARLFRPALARSASL